MRHFSGDMSGMRLLMMDELDLISGGNGEDSDEVIIVKGHKHDRGFDIYVGNIQDYAGGSTRLRTH
ncbi:hypothetical protein AA0535_1969 [Asaia krungthepensis NRIC 0535]|uniref:Uncharacterized protein n=1 Tax=Asaia krungthepensis NRIC 0535 TaxID=1307925 RepID=A0ABQ0Q3V8_9PROT|nr:hypothetical protein AA0535_1969 [Asaia krungthepensis NRIC 0535]